ncbi:MAG: hypothetical protein GY847_05710 [Proteobacteria bacterium]|nr:hypothetical protein [Pseudomonadota bacterium]
MPYTYGNDDWEKAYRAEVADRLESTPKPYVYFTPEWTHTFEKTIQEDAEYKVVAKGWEGSVTFHVESKPEFGVDQDLFLLLDLWHGECRSIRIVPREVGESAEFVITGTIDRWISVGKKQLQPVKGMMQGKLKLKGSLPTIVRHVKSALRLVDLSVDVGGKFPDDLNPDEIEGLRGVITRLGTEFGID